MNNSRKLRQTIAGLLILVLIASDFAAASKTFDNWQQVSLLTILLSITTLLAVIFHLRCRACPSCMASYRKMLNTYYAAFIGIGLLSFCYIMLPHLVDGFIGKALLTTTYLAVIALGVPMAIKSLTGIEEAHAPEQSKYPPQSGEEMAASNNEPPKTPPESEEVTIQALLPETETPTEKAKNSKPVQLSINTETEFEEHILKVSQQQKLREQQEEKRDAFEAREKQQAAIKRRDELAERRRLQRPQERQRIQQKLERRHIQIKPKQQPAEQHVGNVSSKK